ncbi:MAG: glycine cleavage system aminomethyltransferase GcvT [Oligoflexales bacterium]
MEDLRTTSLFQCHKNHKARFVEFGGWNMPVSYEGVLQEHAHVRTQCGIFDVSHMGEVTVKGADALAFLQYLTINDVSKLTPGQGQYSAMLNEKGGMIDDLIMYQLAPQNYLLCVNASNTDKDFAWIQKVSAKFNVTVVNESENWSQLAVQGPKSVECIQKCFDATGKKTVSDLNYMDIAPVKFENKEVLVARTGYTGEMGFEVYLPNAVAEKFWQKIFKENPDVLKPIGLGARDTLRLEACYLLYGNDMDDTVSPLEAGIGWAVRMEKNDFIGKSVLAEQKANGVKRKMAAFLMDEKGIARHGMDIYKDGEKIGTVMSGSFLPTLDIPGGMALFSKNVAVGDTFEVDVRGKRKLAKVAKRPLYSAKVK